MPSSKRRTPKYRHYKPKDLAVVRIDGRDRYLGKFNTPESWELYHRIVAESISGGSVSGDPGEAPQFSDVSVNQILLAYCQFARTYYVRDGELTSEVENITYSLRPVRILYGRTIAKDFGPRRLKTVREYMIDEEDLCRREINKRIGRIKRVL